MMGSVGILERGVGLDRLVGRSECVNAYYESRHVGHATALQCTPITTFIYIVVSSYIIISYIFATIVCSFGDCRYCLLTISVMSIRRCYTPHM